MPLATSGQIKLSDIRAEFGGGSGQISFGDFYRGGSKVRKKAANNGATNDAASVPTSGALDMSDFHGTAASFTKTFSAGATNQDASDIFGDDYSVDYAKNIVINSGVELGATSTGNEALHIDSGGSGTITVTNNGTLTGRGGAAGSAGGDAFEAQVACTVINNGTMRAGGGGGGAGGAGGTGGTGGQGSSTSASYSPWYSRTISAGYGGGFGYVPGGSSSQCRNASWPPARNDSNNRLYGKNGQTTVFVVSSGNPRFYGPVFTATYVSTQALDGDNNAVYSPAGSFQYRTYQTSTQYHPGGSGGAGGSGGSGGGGQGYQQSAGSGGSGSGGSSGSAGGTNAGAGGTGGTGGAGGNGGGYGAAGSNGSSGNTGSTGANGNYTNGQAGSSGSSGSSGGAAGNYIRGLGNVTFTNNGTVQGGTVS